MFSFLKMWLFAERYIGGIMVHCLILQCDEFFSVKALAVIFAMVTKRLEVSQVLENCPSLIKLQRLFVINLLTPEESVLTPGGQSVNFSRL